MSSIKTLEDSVVAATQANFPALVHFWPITEDAGLSMKITDVINGMVLNIGNTTTNIAGVSVNTSTIIDAAPVSGTWAYDNTKVPVVIAMGTDSSVGAFILGSSAADNSTDAIRCGKNGAILDASVGTADSATTLSTPTITMQSLTVDLANAELTSAEASATAVTVNTPDAIANTLNLDAIGNTFGNTFDRIYGFAVFMFDEAPKDIGDAIAWMQYRWAAGNKDIYPGWKDKS